MFQGTSADIDANMWADIDGVQKIDKVKIKKGKVWFVFSAINHYHIV